MSAADSGCILVLSDAHVIMFGQAITTMVVGSFAAIFFLCKRTNGVGPVSHWLGGSATSFQEVGICNHLLTMCMVHWWLHWEQGREGGLDQAEGERVGH